METEFTFIGSPENDSKPIEKYRITQDDNHIADCTVKTRDKIVSVTYRGKKKATQIGGGNWVDLALMLLRELKGEGKAA